MSSDDETSFVILGSTPTPSMELYGGPEQSLTKEDATADSITSNVMQSSAQTINNFSLLNSLSASHTDSVNSDSSVITTSSASQLVRTASALKTSTMSKSDFAEKFLLGEIPADSLKYNIWKHFPSFCSPLSNPEDIDKLESLIGAHVKLKENLQKTNEAMRQHFTTINKWQNKVRRLKQSQANEILDLNKMIGDLREELRLKVEENEIIVLERNEANKKISDLNMIIKELREEMRLKVAENENLHVALLDRDEYNQKLKLQIDKINEEHAEKTMQFNMNLAYASGENKDLVQEISAKNAIIQNMTNMIENLEKQLVSFEMVSVQHDGDRQQSQTNTSSMNESQTSQVDKSQSFSLEKSQSSGDFGTQLSAAREQNIQLLEDVSNKIVKIKRLESESSKLQHQLLSLEMIANENGKEANDDKENVRKLKDELNQMSIQNIKDQEAIKDRHLSEMKQLQQIIKFKELEVDKMYNLKRSVENNTQIMTAQSDKMRKMERELSDLQKANVLYRSREINADIKAHQTDQELTEMKELNALLTAQLDLYKSDFEMERQSRQDIASEREELLSDLKLLQRRNQQLIEEAQSRTRESNGASSSTPSTLSPGPTQEPVGRFICPICNNPSPSLTALQTHVQNCLEN